MPQESETNQRIPPKARQRRVQISYMTMNDKSLIDPFHKFALVPYVPLNRRQKIFTKKDEEMEAPAEIPSFGPDIAFLIMSFCDAKTVSRAACVCREWHQLSHCNQLWEQLCRAVFGVSAAELKPKPDPTKNLYILSHQRFRTVCRQALAVNTNPFGTRQISLPTIPVSSLR